LGPRPSPPRCRSVGIRLAVLDGALAASLVSCRGDGGPAAGPNLGKANDTFKAFSRQRFRRERALEWTGSLRCLVRLSDFGGLLSRPLPRRRRLAGARLRRRVGRRGGAAVGASFLFGIGQQGQKPGRILGRTGQLGRVGVGRSCLLPPALAGIGSFRGSFGGDRGRSGFSSGERQRHPARRGLALFEPGPCNRGVNCARAGVPKSTANGRSGS
jgi:hypothetical protein